MSTEPYRPWVPLLLRSPSLVRFFASWNVQRKSSDSTLDAGVPWLAFEAIEWLDRFLHSRMRVFEWGSGGSTLYLADRVGVLTSIEHDATWHRRVSERLKAAGIANCEYLLREPLSVANDNRASTVAGTYVSTDERFAGYSFLEYCAAIDEHSDDSFDLIVVDGRARPSCVFHAREKVRPGGVILLDNSERPHYTPGLRLLDGWSRRDFTGPVTFGTLFSTTTVFVRPVRDRRLS